jgi:hypothetical protein
MAKPRDPKRLITLQSKARPVPFTITFDEIEAFRAFEASARELPDHAETPQRAAELEGYRRATPPGQFEASPAVLPPAGAVAREALIHFKMTLPDAIKAEFDRLLQAAYITGVVALSEHTKSTANTNPIPLPSTAVVNPSDAMARPAVTDLRRRLVIDAPADNARKVHPKRRGPHRRNDYPAMAREVEARVANGESLAAARANVANDHGIETDTLIEYLRGRPTKRRAKRGRRN